MIFYYRILPAYIFKGEKKNKKIVVLLSLLYWARLLK